MSGFIVAIILVCLIVLIIGVSLYFYYKREKVIREKYTDLYQSSCGIDDDFAYRALDTISKIKKPAIVDNFIAGSIAGLNLLGGNIRGNINKESLTIGTNENRQLVNNVRTIANTFEQVLNQLPENANAEPQHFMIDRIDTFVGGNLDAVRDIRDYFNDMRDTDAFGENAEELETQRALWNDINGQLNYIAEALPRTETLTREKVREEALKTSKTKNAASKAILTKQKNHVSDPQNVHDSSVNKDINKTREKIKANISNGLRPDEVVEYIKSKISHDDKRRENIIRTLNTIERNGETLSDLATVFARSRHTSNRENRENMEEALIDALNDCVEKGTVVCAGGQRARLYGSLVHLDSDKSVGQIQTLSAYRNEIFDEAQNVMTRYKNDMKKNGSQTMKQVAESYDNAKIDVSAEDEAEYNEGLGKKLDELVDSYAEHLPDNKIDEIKRDCRAALV